MDKVKVVRYDAAFGAWEQATARPHPSLRRFVRRYQGYTEIAARFPARRELPTGDAVLILSFSGAFDVTDPRRPEDRRVCRSVVGGPSDSYVLSRLEPGWRGMQVDFTPLGAHAFFDLPTVELANRIVELEDLLGTEARRMLERLEEAPRWSDRFRIMEDRLLRRLNAAEGPPQAVLRAWLRLTETHGRIRIGELAEELGHSRRRLSRDFRDAVGLPPKTLGRILRFGRALDLMNRPDSPGLGRVAVRAGYYDQAHMIRDFRQFAGGPPTELAHLHLPEGSGVRDA